MFARLLVAIGLSTAVIPTSVASPLPPPLHEIVSAAGGTKTCGNVVVHANSAILATLRDDGAIARAIARLRATDFDTLGTSREDALEDLARTSNEVVENVEHARSETVRLREFASHPAGDDRRADLEALANGLDAALDEQRAVAGELDRLVRALQSRGQRASARQAAANPAIDPSDPDTFHGAGRMPTALSTPLLTASERNEASATIFARTHATELARIRSRIAADEARAAAHSELAVEGC